MIIQYCILIPYMKARLRELFPMSHVVKIAHYLLFKTLFYIVNYIIVHDTNLRYETEKYILTIVQEGKFWQ